MAKINPYQQPPTAQVYLVRHGATNLNSGEGGEEKFRAWGDPPLNDEGIGDAHKAGQYLANKGIAHIFASDLGRTQHTAQIISQYTGADVTPVHGLRPWNVGDLTGKPVEPNKKMVEDYQKHPDQPLPGGESYNTFLGRWRQSFSHIVQAASKLGRPVAAVTHTRNVNALEFDVKNTPTKLDSMIPPGGIVRADIFGSHIKLHNLDPEEGLKSESGHFQE